MQISTWRFNEMLGRTSAATERGEDPNTTAPERESVSPISAEPNSHPTDRGIFARVMGMLFTLFAMFHSIGGARGHGL